MERPALLLPEMVAHFQNLCHLQTHDYLWINRVLASVNSLLMNFRGYDLPADLKCCLDNFGKPLSDLFNRTASLIDEMLDTTGAARVASAHILKVYIESQQLCCSIFYSLNFHEVPEFFKEHVSVWMVEFNKYITLNYHGVNELALSDLRAVICENISLYVLKEEDLLFHQGYLCTFVESVLSLLVSSSSHGSKQLIVSAIKFLTAVTGSSHHILLSSRMRQIYESIVIPIIMLHDVDEELFEMNPKEFIRKDLEGSNTGTITRISCELLKGIAPHYKDSVTELVELQTERCFRKFKENPKSNWKYMYCAIYLVTCLAPENAAGTDIVDFKRFHYRFLVHELHNDDVTSLPMVKAISMKFFILFRNQIEKRFVMDAVSGVIRLLTSPNYVVHWCAARFIEEHLLAKDERATLPDKIEGLLLLQPDDGARRQLRTFYELCFSRGGFTSEDISPLLPGLMSNLFCALSNRESEENLYVMKCIMHVVLVGDLTADIASLCIERLTTILYKVCQNPKNPSFNDYLFESLTGLIRRVCFLSKETKGRPCKEEISLMSLLEKKLYPALHMILARGINELFTYGFRLLVELVYLNRPLLPVECYSQVFDILRVPDTWMSQAKGIFPHQLSFPSVIYGKLVSSSAIDDQGYYVLNTVMENLGFEAISPFVRHLWVSLFNRLQYQRMQKSVKNIIVFMSLFLLKDNPKNLFISVNTTVQPNTFQAVLEQFWIPNLKLITHPIELKLTSVVLTRLICESSDIFDIKLWGKILGSIITLVLRFEHTSVHDDEPEYPEFSKAIDFASLHNAGKKLEEDLLKDIVDPRQFLVASLSNLFAATYSQRIKYHPQAIFEIVDEADQHALRHMFDLYNVSIA